MRTDNTHHLVAAAHRRSERARQQVEEALTRLDETTQPATVSGSPGQPESHAPGSTPSLTSWNNSSSGNDPVKRRRQDRLSGRRRHPCTDGCSWPTNESGNSPTRTTACGTGWHGLMGRCARPTLSPAAPRRPRTVRRSAVTRGGFRRWSPFSGAAGNEKPTQWGTGRAFRPKRYCSAG